ncbi:Nn.00g083910.m01.CDS01 [Neocucurbitaria sp. VM-36]
MGVGETITVINKSGKVVSSSKHLVSVFKEAKAAYRERKAEIKAERDAALQEKKLKEGVKALRIDDDVQSRASSRHSKATHRSKSHRRPSRQERPPMERGYTDSFYANDSPRGHRYEQDLAGDAQDAHRMEIARRNSDMHVVSSQTKKSRRDSIDMDLAYGDIPPPLPAKKYDDVELKEKASKITMLLDEANCLQYSVTAMIENLQKNPEALAAVSLTLAEISAIVGKMGPGVLVALKGSFPAVAALLLSPQFMIAGGVAVGVTIVALGGYKIIKKIQAQKDGEATAMPMAMRAGDDTQLELDELEPQELSRVEMWRRGIADVEAVSAGTSVDGEFITPGASRQLVAAGVLDEDDLRSRRSARSRKDGESRSKSHRARSEKSTKTSKTSDTKRSKTVKESSSKKKEKEPSGLKMLFRSHTAHV